MCHDANVTVCCYACCDLVLTYAKIGRFVVGLGGECLSVAQGALVVEWFKNEELGTL